MKVHLDKHRFSNRISAYVMTELHGRRYVAKPVELVEVEQDTYVSQGTFELDQNAAQELMDELWQCGLRPSEGTGSAGALLATQKHLEDMRTLVFKGDK